MGDKNYSVFHQMTQIVPDKLKNNETAFLNWSWIKILTYATNTKLR